MEWLRKFLVVVTLISLCVAKTRWFELENYSFEQYVQEFRKIYSPKEYIDRSAIFRTNLDSIRVHNRDSTKTWKQGVNRMTDWMPSEYKKLLGFDKSLGFANKSKEVQIDKRSLSARALPAHIDWRTKGIISPVKDQGMCGSCWTFGTTETIESYQAMSHNLLSELSEQQILDCTPNTNDCGGTGGCGGGTAELAYAQIMKTGGLSDEWTYPYISYWGTNFPCNSQNIHPVATLKGYKVLPSNQYLPVLTALATVGPLVINVDASAWSSYESGVFDGCNQTHPDIDHVVQLVGYGVDKDFGDYWIVRNSWSPSWGEDGYVRLKRTPSIRCGWDLNPQDGTGCNGGPTEVKVCGTCGLLYDVSYPTMH